MKKQICTLLVLIMSIGFISCSGSRSLSKEESRVQGSWILIEEGGYPVDRKQLKHYTQKNFVWHTMNGRGIITLAGAGEYRLNGNELYEEVDMTMYSNSDFKGRTAKIEIAINKDTMIQNTIIQMQNRENIFTEKWVRVK